MERNFRHADVARCSSSLTGSGSRKGNPARDASFGVLGFELEPRSCQSSDFLGGDRATQLPQRPGVRRTPDG